MTNDTLAIDSFIAFCDSNMAIVEESNKEINSIFNKEMESLKSIKEEIRKNHGNTKKQIQLFKQAVSELTKVKQEVNKMDESEFDKKSRRIKEVVECGCGIFAAAGVFVGLRAIQKATGEYMPFKILTSLASGTFAFVGVSDLFDKISKPNKKAVLNKIDAMIHDYNICIKVLSNPKYAKMISENSSSKDYVEDIKKVNTSNAFVEVKKLAHKMFKNACPKITKIAKDNNVSVTFKIDEDEKYNSVILIVSDKNESSKGIGTDEFYECYEDFYDIDLKASLESEIKAIEKKFDIEIDIRTADGDDENFTYTVSF